MFCCFVCNSFFELVSEKLTSNGEWVASPPQPSGLAGLEWQQVGASKESQHCRHLLPSPTFTQTFSRGHNLGINSFQLVPILGLTILSMPIRLHFNFLSIPGKRHKGVPQSRQRLDDARCWWKLHLYSCFPFLCQITLSIPLKPKTYKTSVMASLL